MARPKTKLQAVRSMQAHNVTLAWKLANLRRSADEAARAMLRFRAAYERTDRV